MNSTADGSGYFLYHSIGMFPGKEALIAEGLRKYAHLWSVPDDSQWPQALAIRAQFIEFWRKLINAQPATLTTAENVTARFWSTVALAGCCVNTMGAFGSVAGATPLLMATCTARRKMPSPTGDRFSRAV